ncbi:hypothetical protein FKG94_18815 [Exilibacterium tricleocarpae]|uniref:Uncharacterized protein n=1 Tax=Exilibacterium tricleocarpae TaxID=2591008 RepID=A0A545T3A7_9GAMM|nr:DUF6776 family protein [Exilibacterium tricleocarpae]TQV71707.1 hypothetical protein FKG94_18815 [Exilibacterium tricleocarpae]
MVAVRGSKQFRKVVVPYRPMRRVTVGLVVAAGVVLAVVGSYLFGDFNGGQLQAQAVAERDRLRLEVAAKTQEADELRQQVANLKLGAQVDRKASEDVRGEVIELKAQIAELQEDITFYRGLMAPTGNKRGLTIGSLDVISTGAPREYQYRVVVQQLAVNHQVLSGYLQFNVVGRQAGIVSTIPLKDLSEQVGSDNIRLRFKYFQNLEGKLVLPEGFEPERIELLAKSTGRNAATVEKQFGWLVQQG